jgi:RNA polymerase sigma-70 factor (ECF subfamily)
MIQPKGSADSMDDVVALVGAIQAIQTPVWERKAAFTELVRRFQDMVYGCAFALVGDHQIAQDVAQETFLTVYQRIGQLREPGAFLGWLRRITLNHCHRATRQQRAPIYPLSSVSVPANEDVDPVARWEHQEVRRAVWAAIHALPETQRVVAVLVYVDGYSQQEVATFLELSLDTVKKRWERARRQLRERMIDMVRTTLRQQRPSSDERLVQALQLATALEATALDSQVAMLELLLVDGLNVDARDKDGQTLLHWAARQGHIDAVALLLQHKATANLKDKAGKTPLQLAFEAGHRQVAELLRQYAGEG